MLSEPSFLFILYMAGDAINAKKEKIKKCHQCYTQLSMTALTMTQLPVL